MQIRRVKRLPENLRDQCIRSKLSDDAFVAVFDDHIEGIVGSPVEWLQSRFLGKAEDTFDMHIDDGDENQWRIEIEDGLIVFGHYESHGQSEQMGIPLDIIKKLLQKYDQKKEQKEE